MTQVNGSLANLVESLLPVRGNQFEGLSCLEIAALIDRSAPHTNQILNKLLAKKKICFSRERRGIQRKVSIYYKKSSDLESPLPDNSSEKLKTCGGCQRFTALCRCSLLDFAYSKGVLFDPQLEQRVQKEILSPETPSCQFHDKRVNGKYKSKAVNEFIKRNTHGGYNFHCPIERCQKIITELSSSLITFKMGFSTFYCPHCGSPMAMGFDNHLNRYEIRYWDARFDIFRRDFQALTGIKLKKRKSAKNLGFSIPKNAFHKLNLKDQLIYLSGKPITENSVDDVIFFPLKMIKYISCGDWSDYFTLRNKLHAEYQTEMDEPRKLYGKIAIYEPHTPPQSVEPSPLEVGGNEIFIATGICNNLCLMGNIQSREAILESTTECSSSATDLFSKAKNRLQVYMGKVNIPRKLDYKYWQQLEGGSGSLMLKPFKEEAKQYGFYAPSREKARNVRGEYFLPYANDYARSDYHSAINSINHFVGNVIKEVVYNELQFAFDGLRGWCHRNYPRGLFYDDFELAKLIGIPCLNRAIREERLLPAHFEKKRGKRFDLLYCIKPGSEGERVVKEIGQEVLQTKIVPFDGKTTKVLQLYKDSIGLRKKLNTNISISSSKVIVKDSKLQRNIAPWKILQETKDSTYLPNNVLRALMKHVAKFLRDEMPFHPVAVQEVLIDG